MPNKNINHTFAKNPVSPQDATISTYQEEPSPHTMKITKNSMSPQDLTIFKHHEDNKCTMQMSQMLMQQQDLRQTSNICKHSISISMPTTPTQPWYQVTYGIIKSILSKPRRYKPNQELILHCHPITVTSSH